MWPASKIGVGQGAEKIRVKSKINVGESIQIEGTMTKKNYKSLNIQGVAQ